jgi:hypothetical protein
MKSKSSDDNQSYNLAIVICECTLQHYDVKSFISDVNSFIFKSVQCPDKVPISIINPGMIFSSDSPFSNRNVPTKFIESDRILQEYFNYVISIQPSVLIIEDIDKIIPYEGTTRYRNNPGLYEKHAKVCHTDK